MYHSTDKDKRRGLELTGSHQAKWGLLTWLLTAPTHSSAHSSLTPGCIATCGLKRGEAAELLFLGALTVTSQWELKNPTL